MEGPITSTKFGDFSFCSFGFIVLIDRQTHCHTRSDAAKRFTPATVVAHATKIKQKVETLKIQINSKS